MVGAIIGIILLLFMLVIVGVGFYAYSKTQETLKYVIDPKNVTEPNNTEPNNTTSDSMIIAEQEAEEQIIATQRLEAQRLEARNRSIQSINNDTKTHTVSTIGGNCPCDKNGWCNTDDNKCYAICNSAGSCDGKLIPRRDKYYCNFSNCRTVSGKLSPPGGNCPCDEKISYCKDGKCYERCYKTGSCDANSVPRQDTYYCNYSNCDTFISDPLRLNITKTN